MYKFLSETLLCNCEIMSFLPIGEKDEDDTDSRSRQIDDAQSVMNSANLIKTSLKDIRVQNVCGSTAGAGSGTFHKYRQCKRREQFRLDILKKEHKINQINQRIQKRKRQNDEILEKKRNKKRKLRHKRKERRQRAKEQQSNNHENTNISTNNDQQTLNQQESKQNNDNIPTKNENDKLQNKNNSKSEDQELQELLNLDQDLTNKQIENDIKHENKNGNVDNDEDEDDDLHQNEKNKKEPMNEQDAVLAALTAEFGDD